MRKVPAVVRPGGRAMRRFLQSLSAPAWRVMQRRCPPPRWATWRIRNGRDEAGAGPPW